MKDRDEQVDKESYERQRPRKYASQMRRRKRRREVFFARTIFGAGLFLILFLMLLLGKYVVSFFQGDHGEQSVLYRMVRKEERKIVENPPELIVELLTYNEYSRVGHALPEVKNIFVHYTANPGTGAAQNRSYFQNLKDTHETSASAHFIVGLDGEVVQCIPTNEVAYAVAGRNYDSISIECCYESEDGKFNEATYQSLVHLSAWLLTKFELTEEDLMRHYDDNGKICPKYYVEHEDAWEQFKGDVALYIEQNGVLESQLLGNEG